jgi:hypothetical protein
MCVQRIFILLSTLDERRLMVQWWADFWMLTVKAAFRPMILLKMECLE